VIDISKNDGLYLSFKIMTDDKDYATGVQAHDAVGPIEEQLSEVSINDDIITYMAYALLFRRLVIRQHRCSKVSMMLDEKEDCKSYV
jgi:hypothetical protein